MKPRRLFVDANAIIGAFGVYEGRSRLWTAICEGFSVETLALCVEETQRGDPRKAGYVPVPPRELAQVRVLDLSAGMEAAFEVQSDLFNLDAGELHLLAWLYFEESRPPSAPGQPRTLPADLLIATADGFALRALQQLGWLQDHVVSLEWLAGQAGVEFPPPDRIPTQHGHQVEAWMRRRKRLLRG